MSEADLSSLRARLLALPASEVQAPNLPMAVILQEANDVLTLVSAEAVWSQLGAVGTQLEARTLLSQAIGATRAAQSRWTLLRDRRKHEAQKQREVQSQALRTELLTVGRWNLRHDRAAQDTLRAIGAGNGVANLIQDLSDLAVLFECKRAAFSADRSFDLPARVEQARTLSSELAASTSAARLDSDQTSALDLRNRAYSLLCGLLASMRATGRYAFRDQPDMRKRFASPYLRQKAQRARAAARAPEAAEAASEA